MRWIVALALVMAGPAAAAEYGWPVLRVIDGDTIEVALVGLPPELRQVSVRVLGVDTPETGSRAGCAAERALGNRATAYVMRAVASGRVTFEPLGWDKYGGRIDAVVRIDGRDLAAELIRRGLGRRYDGGKRGGWC
jgi:endonuclease YncB( thermonuclease family)